MNPSAHQFSRTDFSKIHSSWIIVDIDNTLVVPGMDVLSDAVKRVVGELISQGNTVYICSNFKHHERNLALAMELGVAYIHTPYLKPSPKVIAQLPIGRPLIVVGDKWSTDGLFALFISANFIKVTSLFSEKEPWWSKAFSVFDQIIGRPIFLLCTLFSKPITDGKITK